MEFFRSMKPLHLNSPRWASTPLSAIIDHISLVVPSDEKDSLVTFNPKQFSEQQPQLWSAIKKNFSDPDENSSVTVDLIDHIKHYADKGQLPKGNPPTYRDIYYYRYRGLQSWRLRERAVGLCEFDPIISLRISERHSPMFFLTFVQQTHEGEALLEKLHAKIEKLPAFLSQIQVSYPSSLISERLMAIEFRALRRNYDDEHNRLVAEREPVRQVIELYEKRVRYIKVLHGDYLRDIHVAMSPLPFFLEYPLRRFRLSDDRLDKIVCAQQMLTVLVKSLVLLPLEEAVFQTTCLETIKSLAQEPTQKAFSDGGWLDLLGRLRKVCEENKFPLPLFGQMLTDSAGEIEQSVLKLVEARNRFHHPPNDAERMLAAFETELPKVENFLRERLAGVKVFIPQSLQFHEGRKVVRGLQLNGFETEFRNVDYEVESPLESFPSGRSVAMNSNGQNVVVLGRFFTSKPVKASTIDIGIFDRVQSNQTCFEFVRGLGGDEKMQLASK